MCSTNNSTKVKVCSTQMTEQRSECVVQKSGQRSRDVVQITKQRLVYLKVTNGHKNGRCVSQMLLSSLLRTECECFHYKAFEQMGFFVVPHTLLLQANGLNLLPQLL